MEGDFVGVDTRVVFIGVDAIIIWRGVLDSLQHDGELTEFSDEENDVGELFWPERVAAGVITVVAENCRSTHMSC